MQFDSIQELSRWCPGATARVIGGDSPTPKKRGRRGHWRITYIGARM
jgi:hypothetical protein